MAVDCVGDTVWDVDTLRLSIDVEVFLYTPSVPSDAMFSTASIFCSSCSVILESKILSSLAEEELLMGTLELVSMETPLSVATPSESEGLKQEASVPVMITAGVDMSVSALLGRGGDEALVSSAAGDDVTGKGVVARLEPADPRPEDNTDLDESPVVLSELGTGEDDGELLLGSLMSRLVLHRAEVTLEFC